MEAITLTNITNAKKLVYRGRQLDKTPTLGDLLDIMESFGRVIDLRSRFWAALPQSKLLTVREFAKWSGFTIAKTTYLCREGLLKGEQAQKRGGWMIPTSELLRLLHEAEENLLPADVRSMKNSY